MEVCPLKYINVECKESSLQRVRCYTIVLIYDLFLQSTEISALLRKQKMLCMELGAFIQPCSISSFLCLPGLAWYLDKGRSKLSPANQPEPREAVIKGVSACHHIVTVFYNTRGHFSRPVIHLSHQVQPLSAVGGEVNKKSTQSQHKK